MQVRRKMRIAVAALAVMQMFMSVTAAEVEIDAEGGAASSKFKDTNLPEGIRDEYVTVNGISFYTLHAGPDTGPLVMFLHGFPETARGWSHQLQAAGAAGFHAVAVDQRGYGYTEPKPAVDLEGSNYRRMMLVGDSTSLVFALGYHECYCLVGHDWGAGVAMLAAAVRPDVFKSLYLTSVPFLYEEINTPKNFGEALAPFESMGLLHYVQIFGKAEAGPEFNKDIAGFLLKGYVMLGFEGGNHYWESCKTDMFPLAVPIDNWSFKSLFASQKGGPATDDLATIPWFDKELFDYYVKAFEYGKLDGPLGWYKGALHDDLKATVNLKIRQPVHFIVGERDMCIHPNYMEAMMKRHKETMPGLVETTIVEGSGHWLHLEKPEIVSEKMLKFLSRKI